MGEYAIQADKLSKRFLLGSRGGSRRLHELFERTMRRVIPGLGRENVGEPHSTDRSILWAVRDINLRIRHGELVGLVGHNGAGKSVLLKILSRITWPTAGHAVIEGKVGSMLEVGAGFHPEFTGRENLFLVGAILGMKVSEIRSKFDEIVAFSEVEDFLDTPVKRYSSGMYVRLAFSVAAHLDANIMLFDEVISVADAEFRAKCVERVLRMREEGRTVIFVSHNMDTVRSFCPRTLVLEKGRLVHDGPTEGALERFSRPPEPGPDDGRGSGRT